MPDPTNLKSDSKKADDSGAKVVGGAVAPHKEKEPTRLQSEGLAQIKEIDKEDEAVEAEIKSVLEDAKLASAEPRISKDLKGAGVRSPALEASEVVADGTSLAIPITEEEFKKGQHAKFSAHVNERKDVIGVSSIIAFAMLVGRLIKLAHKHTIGKIIFKKKETGNAD